MLFRFAFALLLLSTSGLLPSPATAQQSGCVQFDAWVWAQTVFLQDPEEYLDLDPDGNGIACQNLLPVSGAAPALWTDAIPDDVQQGELLRVFDGDTYQVLIDGRAETVRIYRADTPETYETQQCGGEEATLFARQMFGFNDESATIYLEQDDTLRDRHGRLLAYIWFTIDGLPYMLNEAIVRSGWGEDINYGDERYDRELTEAAAFAERFDLGVYGICNGFGIPKTNPTSIPTGTSAECDPSYPDNCIPPLSVYGDLDCENVPDRRFRVLPADPHQFDVDRNGIGCENYETEYVGLP